jgi:hypothetical protein
MGRTSPTTGGLGMKRFIAAATATVLLGVLSPAQQAVTPQVPANCAKLQGVELALEQTPFGYTVPVKVAGIERHFLLDLTQPFSIIDEDVATGLKLEGKKLPSGFQVFFAFRNLTKYTSVPGVEFGTLPFPPTDFVLWKKFDMSTMNAGNTAPAAKAPSIDGAIGINILARLDFELDLKNKKLRLYLPDHCPFTPDWGTGPAPSIPFAIDTSWNALSIPAVLDDKAVTLALNLSEKEATMLGFRASKVFGFDVFTKDLMAMPRDPGQAGMPKQFTTTRRQYPFRKMAAGALTINNPKIAILGPLGRVCNDPRSADFEMICYRRDMGDVVLGTNVLGNLHLYFSQVEKKLYFTPYAAATADQTPK